MGYKAFFYYISSIKKYLQSEEGKEDSAFFYIVDILKYRYKYEDDFRCAFETQKDNILDVLTLMKEIVEQPDFQEENADCYSDLPSRVNDLIELCKK